MTQIRGDRAIWRRIGDEAVLVDLESGTYIGVNRTGTVILEMLKGGATEREIVVALVNRFSVTSEQAAGDVAEFLASLRERAMVDD